MRNFTFLFGGCMLLASSMGTYAAVPEIITEAPEGKTVTYLKGSEGRSPLSQQYYNDCGAAEIVYTDDNKVYMKGVLSYPANMSGSEFKDGYVQGSIEDGVITVPTGQYTGYIPDRLRGYGLVVMRPDEEAGWVVDSEKTQINFFVAEDGSVTLDENTTVGLINISNGNEGSWARCAEWVQTYTVFDEKAVTKPDNVTASEWGITTSDGSGHIIKVGIDGNDIYVGGLSEDMPDAWIKGTIDGDKVTFEPKQYMGVCNRTHQFLMTADAGIDENGEVVYTFSDAAVFDYDSAALTLKSVDNKALLVNGSLREVYCIAALDSPFMYYFTGYEAATPVNPVNLYTEGFDPYLLRGKFEFQLLLVDTDGKLLSPDNYTYNIFIDKEPFTFTSDEYTSLDYDELTDIPYDYDDGWDITVIGIDHMIKYFLDGIETLGVQAIYTVDGVSNKSAIVNLNVETGEISVEEPSVGVNTTDASREVKEETYYDLLGRRVTVNQVNGIMIKRTTYSDGSTESAKFVVK